MTAHGNVHSFKKQSTKLKKSSINAQEHPIANNAVEFLKDARKAAKQHDCKFLFEFPASLIDPAWEKGAAILCPSPKGYLINFLLFNDENKEINVVEATNAPVHLVNFACSFANILTVLPAGESKTVQ